MTLFTAVLRHARRLSTATAAAAAMTPPVPTLSNSEIRNKLKSVLDPDKALDLYRSFSASTSLSSIRYAQEYTVRLLAQSHRFSDIETFLESHKTNTSQITQEPFLSSLIRSYGAAGMFENALKTYEQMTDFGTPKTSLSFNTLLTACLQSKLFDSVPTYFFEFPEKFNFLPDKSSYGILIKSYCEMGSPELATEKLNEMESKGFELDSVVVTPIFHSLYGKRGRDEAKKFWHEMVGNKGVKPNVDFYNLRLLRTQDGDREGLKRLIEEMRDAGIEPDVMSYNYLIPCYCKCGMMDEAEKLYEELFKDKGCCPNSVSLRNLVFYMCKHERFVAAYKVFKQSVRDQKCAHHFGPLKDLVEGLVKTGHKNEAHDMIRTMMKKLPHYLSECEKLAEDLGLSSVGTNEVDLDENRLI